MLYFLPLSENSASSARTESHMRSYFVVALVASSLLAGCSFDSVVARVNPYKIDVRQGNYVDQDMVSQLRRGMTRDQVRFVLGSPLVVDVFRSDRWDYVYRYKPGRGDAEQRVISVFFVDEVLDRVEGDVQAAATGEAGSGAQSGRSRVVEIPAPERK
jgi:outer membrane protein assembly factor BamE